MAPNAQTRSKAEKKPNTDNKPNTIVFTPNRQLTRTPPLPPRPAKNMLIKKSETSEKPSKAADTLSTASNSSSEPFITVQDNPLSSKDAKIPPTKPNEKNSFHQNINTASTKNTPTTSLKKVEQMMFQALQQLQEIYNVFRETKANKITIERTIFEKIATTFQQAYEQIETIKEPTTTPENTSILDALRQIQADIANINITEAVTNASKASTSPKTYADTLKTLVLITAAQLHKHQEQQRVRAQKIQFMIILNINETSKKTQQ